MYLQHAAHRRIERGFPQLFGVHFAEAFVALDVVGFFAFGEQGVDDLVEVFDFEALFAVLEVGAVAQEAAHFFAERVDVAVFVAVGKVGVEGVLAEVGVLFDAHIDACDFSRQDFGAQGYARFCKAVQLALVGGEPFL